MKKIYLLVITVFFSFSLSVQADMLKSYDLRISGVVDDTDPLENPDDPFWDTYLLELDRNTCDFPTLVNGNTYYLVVKYGDYVSFVHPAVYNYDTESSISTEQHGCLVDDFCELGFYNINSDREYNAEDYDDLEGAEFERNRITFFFHYSMGMGDARSWGNAISVEIWDTCPEDYTYTCP